MKIAKFLSCIVKLAANGPKLANSFQEDPKTKSKIGFILLSKKILTSNLRRSILLSKQILLNANLSLI